MDKNTNLHLFQFPNEEIGFSSSGDHEFESIVCAGSSEEHVSDLHDYWKIEWASSAITGKTSAFSTSSFSTFSSCISRGQRVVYPLKKWWFLCSRGEPAFWGFAIHETFQQDGVVKSWETTCRLRRWNLTKQEER